MSVTKRIIIMGAGGRDFHVFNTCYRDNTQYEVVAFTAAQIPHIENRIYPAVLAGPRYLDGIPIRSQRELEALVQTHGVGEVVFAYSDVSFEALESIALNASRLPAHGSARSIRTRV